MAEQTLQVKKQITRREDREVQIKSYVIVFIVSQARSLSLALSHITGIEILQKTEKILFVFSTVFIPFPEDRNTQIY